MVAGWEQDAAASSSATRGRLAAEGLGKGNGRREFQCRSQQARSDRAPFSPCLSLTRPARHATTAPARRRHRPARPPGRRPGRRRRTTTTCAGERTEKVAPFFVIVACVCGGGCLHAREEGDEEEEDARNKETTAESGGSHADFFLLYPAQPRRRLLSTDLLPWTLVGWPGGSREARERGQRGWRLRAIRSIAKKKIRAVFLLSRRPGAHTPATRRVLCGSVCVSVCEQDHKAIHRRFTHLPTLLALCLFARLSFSPPPPLSSRAPSSWQLF